ncbi:unnamed protein product [Amoebophrya sp. A120]|nr:unnamed protein product [Amoebophrya sp. A120]|eukprot:GSA120T00022554001.1
MKLKTDEDLYQDNLSDRAVGSSSNSEHISGKSSKTTLVPSVQTSKPTRDLILQEQDHDPKLGPQENMENTTQKNGVEKQRSEVFFASSSRKRRLSDIPAVGVKKTLSRGNTGHLSSNLDVLASLQQKAAKQNEQARAVAEKARSESRQAMVSKQKHQPEVFSQPLLHPPRQVEVVPSSGGESQVEVAGAVGPSKNKISSAPTNRSTQPGMAFQRDSLTARQKTLAAAQVGKQLQSHPFFDAELQDAPEEPMGDHVMFGRSSNSSSKKSTSRPSKGTVGGTKGKTKEKLVDNPAKMRTSSSIYIDSQIAAARAQKKQEMALQKMLRASSNGQQVEQDAFEQDLFLQSQRASKGKDHGSNAVSATEIEMKNSRKTKRNTTTKAKKRAYSEKALEKKIHNDLEKRVAHSVTDFSPSPRAAGWNVSTHVPTEDELFRRRVHEITGLARHTNRQLSTKQLQKSPSPPPTWREGLRSENHAASVPAWSGSRRLGTSNKSASPSPRSKTGPRKKTSKDHAKATAGSTSSHSKPVLERRFAAPLTREPRGSPSHQHQAAGGAENANNNAVIMSDNKVKNIKRQLIEIREVESLSPELKSRSNHTTTGRSKSPRGGGTSNNQAAPELLKRSSLSPHQPLEKFPGVLESSSATSMADDRQHLLICPPGEPRISPPAKSFYDARTSAMIREIGSTSTSTQNLNYNGPRQSQLQMLNSSSSPSGTGTTIVQPVVTPPQQQFIRMEGVESPGVVPPEKRRSSRNKSRSPARSPPRSPTANYAVLSGTNTQTQQQQRRSSSVTNASPGGGQQQDAEQASYLSNQRNLLLSPQRAMALMDINNPALQQQQMQIMNNMNLNSNNNYQRQRADTATTFFSLNGGFNSSTSYVTPLSTTGNTWFGGAGNNSVGTSAPPQPVATPAAGSGPNVQPSPPSMGGNMMNNRVRAPSDERVRTGLLQAPPITGTFSTAALPLPASAVKEQKFHHAQHLPGGNKSPISPASSSRPESPRRLNALQPPSLLELVPGNQQSPAVAPPQFLPQTVLPQQVELPQQPHLAAVLASQNKSSTSPSDSMPRQTSPPLRAAKREDNQSPRGLAGGKQFMQQTKASQAQIRASTPPAPILTQPGSQQQPSPSRQSRAGTRKEESQAETKSRSLTAAAEQQNKKKKQFISTSRSLSARDDFLPPPRARSRSPSPILPEPLTAEEMQKRKEKKLELKQKQAAATARLASRGSPRVRKTKRVLAEREELEEKRRELEEAELLVAQAKVEAVKSASKLQTAFGRVVSEQDQEDDMVNKAAAGPGGGLHLGGTTAATASGSRSPSSTPKRLKVTSSGTPSAEHAKSKPAAGHHLQVGHVLAEVAATGAAAASNIKVVHVLDAPQGLLPVFGGGSTSKVEHLLKPAATVPGAGTATKNSSGSKKASSPRGQAPPTSAISTGTSQEPHYRSPLQHEIRRHVSASRSRSRSPGRATRTLVTDRKVNSLDIRPSKDSLAGSTSSQFGQLPHDGQHHIQRHPHHDHPPGTSGAAMVQPPGAGLHHQQPSTTTRDHRVVVIPPPPPATTVQPISQFRISRSNSPVERNRDQPENINNNKTPSVTDQAIEFPIFKNVQKVESPQWPHSPQPVLRDHVVSSVKDFRAKASITSCTSGPRSRSRSPSQKSSPSSPPVVIPGSTVVAKGSVGVHGHHGGPLVHRGAPAAERSDVLHQHPGREHLQAREDHLLHNVRHSVASTSGRTDSLPANTTFLPIGPEESWSIRDEVSLLNEIEGVLDSNKSRIEEMLADPNKAAEYTLRNGNLVRDPEAEDKIIDVRASPTSARMHVTIKRKGDEEQRVETAHYLHPPAALTSSRPQSGRSSRLPSARASSALDEEAASLQEQKQIAISALRNIRATLSRARGSNPKVEQNHSVQSGTSAGAAAYGSSVRRNASNSTNSQHYNVVGGGAGGHHLHQLHSSGGAAAGGPLLHPHISQDISVSAMESPIVNIGGGGHLHHGAVVPPQHHLQSTSADNDADNVFRHEFSKRLELHSNLIKSLRSSLGFAESDHSVSAEDGEWSNAVTPRVFPEQASSTSGGGVFPVTTGGPANSGGPLLSPRHHGKIKVVAVAHEAAVASAPVVPLSATATARQSSASDTNVARNKQLPTTSTPGGSGVTNIRPIMLDVKSTSVGDEQHLQGSKNNTTSFYPQAPLTARTSSDAAVVTDAEGVLPGNHAGGVYLPTPGGSAAGAVGAAGVPAAGAGSSSAAAINMVPTTGGASSSASPHSSSQQQISLQVHHPTEVGQMNVVDDEAAAGTGGTVVEEAGPSSNTAASPKQQQERFLFYEPEKIAQRMAYLEDRVSRFCNGEDISPRKPATHWEEEEGEDIIDGAGGILDAGNKNRTSNHSEGLVDLVPPPLFQSQNKEVFTSAAAESGSVPRQGGFGSSITTIAGDSAAHSATTADCTEESTAIILQRLAAQEASSSSSSEVLDHHYGQAGPHDPRHVTGIIPTCDGGTGTGMEEGNPQLEGRQYYNSEQEEQQMLNQNWHQAQTAQEGLPDTPCSASVEEILRSGAAGPDPAVLSTLREIRQGNFTLEGHLLVAQNLHQGPIGVPPSAQGVDRQQVVSQPAPQGATQPQFLPLTTNDLIPRPGVHVQPAAAPTTTTRNVSSFSQRFIDPLNSPPLSKTGAAQQNFQIGPLPPINPDQLFSPRVAHLRATSPQRLKVDVKSAVSLPLSPRPKSPSNVVNGFASPKNLFAGPGSNSVSPEKEALDPAGNGIRNQNTNVAMSAAQLLRMQKEWGRLAASTSSSSTMRREQVVQEVEVAANQGSSQQKINARANSLPIDSPRTVIKKVGKAAEAASAQIQERMIKAGAATTSPIMLSPRSNSNSRSPVRDAAEDAENKENQNYRSRSEGGQHGRTENNSLSHNFYTASTKAKTTLQQLVFVGPPAQQRGLSPPSRLDFSGMQTSPQLRTRARPGTMVASSTRNSSTATSTRPAISGAGNGVVGGNGNAATATFPPTSDGPAPALAAPQQRTGARVAVMQSTMPALQRRANIPVAAPPSAGLQKRGLAMTAPGIMTSSGAAVSGGAAQGNKTRTRIIRATGTRRSSELDPVPEMDEV